MHPGQFGIPGQSAATTTVSNEILWGGDASKIPVFQKSVVFSSTAVDAGSSPTSFLRAGLLMGEISATGEQAQYNPAASDGTQYLTGINAVEQVMVDGLGTAVDRFGPMVVSAPVKARALFILGAALVGSAHEFVARRAMHALGFKLDDDLQGFLSGAVRRITTKATNYTVVKADQGTIFQAKTADATFTLPAIQNGLFFTFQQTADFEMSVASAEGDNMVVGNDLSADSVTFTTASEQIGAQVDVEAKYVDGTLKWVVTLPHVPFGTGTATMTYGIAT